MCWRGVRGCWNTLRRDESASLQVGGKRLHHPPKNTIHISQGHAIVANRNASVDKEIRSVEQLLARAHAASALDGHGIFFGIGNGGEARHIFKLDVFSGVFQDHAGQFHAADVLAGAVVGAGFE